MVAAGGCMVRESRSALVSLERAIATLSGAHQHRDQYTVQHQLRVAALAAAIAVDLGLHPETVAVLRLAASVHDIGKIAIPAEIMFRADSLTDGEYALMKTHSAIGQDILQRLESPYKVAQIVAQHHERLDGSGYPGGLRAAEILPEARILAVADVFDAMTSKRPYRDGLPADFVLGHLQDKAGSLLDADAVAACRNCILRRDVTTAQPASASARK
jgi:putative two-component system response regulator